MNPDPDFTDRVDALQRELLRVRRTLRIVGILAASAAVLAILAVAIRWLPVREVRTQTLTLIDGAGRTRARLETNTEGPELSLRDADESIRARLSLQGSLGALVFSDREGTERVALSARPGLLMRDSENRRVALEISGDGPALEVVDPAGYAALHPLDGLKLYYGTGALAAALAPGALSLYGAPERDQLTGSLAVTLSAPRRPGERVRLLLFEDRDQPSFSAP